MKKNDKKQTYAEKRLEERRQVLGQLENKLMQAQQAVNKLSAAVATVQGNVQTWEEVVKQEKGDESGCGD